MLSLLSHVQRSPVDGARCYGAGVTNPPGARAVGRALRMARDDASMTARALAAKINVAHSTVTQWERSRRLPRVADVEKVLDALSVTGKRRDMIVARAAHAHESNRLTTAIPGISETLTTMIECEHDADTITVWSPLLVPGLLQIGAYARWVLAHKSRSSREVDTRVTLRVGRREVLTRRDAPGYTALLGEGMLCTNVGGCEVMADQINHIIEMGRRANVSIRLVPQNVGYHHGLIGTFSVYHFIDTPPVVLLEHHRSSSILYDTPDVPEYVDAARDIAALALTEEESFSRLTAAAHSYEPGEG